MAQHSELHKLRIRRSSQITGLAGYREKSRLEIERREQSIRDLDSKIQKLEEADRDKDSE